MVRILFIASYLANVVLGLVALFLLPDRVAIHFGANGVPDSWASNMTNAVMMLGVNTVLFITMYLAGKITVAVPAKWVSLPNKDYWLRPENKPRAERMVAEYTWRYGIAIFLLLFVAGVLAIHANLSKPVRLNEKLFLGALTLFFVYTAIWCVRFFRAFRVLKAGPEEPKSQ